MDIDYTFKNTLIKAYFDGDNSYIPVGELKYLHAHPMVSPNFITELDDIVLKAGRIMTHLKLAHLNEQLIKEGIIIGQNLKGDGLEISDQSGLEILEAFRRLYNLCKDVIDKLGSAVPAI